jgi:hypothetical protein
MAFEIDRAIGNALLLTTYSASKEIRVYLVQIQWNAPKNSPEVISPNLMTSHVYTESHISPTITVNNPESLMDTENPTYVHLRLSHLEMVSVAPPTKHSDVSFPTIAAVFSELSVEPQYTGQQSTFCVLKRWTLKPASPSMHPSINQLTSKGAIEPSSKVRRLHRKRFEYSD